MAAIAQAPACGTRACAKRIGTQAKDAHLARYYFHLYNGEALCDDTGEDFVDDTAAREAAVRGIAELIAEQIAGGSRVDLRHRIEIQDDRGNIVCILKFGQFFDGCSRNHQWFG